MATAQQPVDPSDIPSVDIGDEPEWAEPPVVTFGQQASLEIARWVLGIFAGVYVLCFVMAFCMFFVKDASFEGSLELVKFLLSSILPLVTLAVGYYLGERSSSSQ